MAHQALGCSGAHPRRPALGRHASPAPTGLVVLELNTQPGMTPLSLAPEQAKWAGISWPELMTWMVEHARHAGMSRAPASKSRPAGAARLRPPQAPARAPIRKTGRPIWRQPLLLRPRPCCCWAWAAAAAGGPGAKAGWSRPRTSVDRRHAQRHRRGHAVQADRRHRRGPRLRRRARRSWRRSTSRRAIRCSASTSRPPRKRLEAIDWVASATVERRLPDTLYVTLKERRAVAIWQNGTEYTLIDKNGRTVRASRMPPVRRVAAAAGRRRRARACRRSAAAAGLRAVDRQAPAGARSGSASGAGTWFSTNDIEIWLPEEDRGRGACQRLAKLEARTSCLSREFGVVDLRLPDKLVLEEARPRPATAPPSRANVKQRRNVRRTSTGRHRGKDKKRR